MEKQLKLKPKFIHYDNGELYYPASDAGELLHEAQVQVKDLEQEVQRLKDFAEEVAEADCLGEIAKLLRQRGLEANNE